MYGKGESKEVGTEVPSVKKPRTENADFLEIKIYF